jgi:hypothetical protein
MSRRPPTALLRRQRQITEHVVKRTVLKHQYDDVIESVQPHRRLIARRRDRIRRRRRDRSGDQLDYPAPFSSAAGARPLAMLHARHARGTHSPPGSPTADTARRCRHRAPSPDRGSAPDSRRPRRWRNRSQQRSSSTSTELNRSRSRSRASASGLSICSRLRRSCSSDTSRSIRAAMLSSLIPRNPARSEPGCTRAAPPDATGSGELERDLTVGVDPVHE